MEKFRNTAILSLRFALAAGFLSAVASRLHFWGSRSSGWIQFVVYTGEVNSFLPKSMIPAIAVLSTVLEISLAILLIVGYKTRWAAMGAGSLLLLFAVAMAYSFGIKEPLDYSVFAASFSAWLLATMPGYKWSLDEKFNTTKYINMNTEKTNQVQIRFNHSAEWLPLVEEGIKTEGLFVQPLRIDAETKRAPTFLLKFEPGSSYPNHGHPAGEEVYVLEGEARFGPDQLRKGDYMYTVPGATHSVYSKTGCVLLFVVPEEVEIL